MEHVMLRKISRATLVTLNVFLSDDSETDQSFEAKLDAGWSLLLIRLALFVPILMILLLWRSGVLGLSWIAALVAAVAWFLVFISALALYARVNR